MKVVLASLGRFHTHRTASELRKGDMLGRFFTGHARVPVPVEVAPYTTTYPLLRFIANYALTRAGATSALHRSTDHFDGWVARHIAADSTRMDVFHGYSQYCLKSLNSAKAKGACCVVERAGAHIDQQIEIVQAASSRWGIPIGSYLQSYFATRSRMIAEYDSADWILTCSEGSRRSFCERGISAEKVATIPLGSNFAPVASRSPQTGKFTVLSIGGDFVRKGIPTLLEAWEQVNLPNAELRLITSVPTRLPYKWRRLLNRRDVCVLGRMGHAQLRIEFQLASLFCLASLEDGFSMAALEAMAHGVPVVVSTGAGSSDLVIEGVNGFTFKPDDLDGLAKHILFAYQNPEAVALMSAASITTASACNWKLYGDRLRAFYRQIAVSTHCAAGTI